MIGKHITLQNPIKICNDYYDYKSFFSILFALVNAHYNFICANIDCQGRISDGGIFKICILYCNIYKKKKIEINRLKAPQALSIPQRSIYTPFLFKADDALSLAELIMKSFLGTHSMKSKK